MIMMLVIIRTLFLIDLLLQNRKYYRISAVNNCLWLYLTTYSSQASVIFNHLAYSDQYLRILPYGLILSNMASLSPQMYQKSSVCSTLVNEWSLAVYSWYRLLRTSSHVTANFTRNHWMSDKNLFRYEIYSHHLNWYIIFKRNILY